MKYQVVVVIETTDTGFSSYSPDLPGCASTGATREECEQNMREAIVFHLEGLREEGDSGPSVDVPKPTKGPDNATSATRGSTETTE